MLARNKKFVIEIGTIGSVIFIKIDIVVVKPFEFIQFIVNVFLDDLFSAVRSLDFDFIYSVVVNEPGDDTWFKFFEERDLFFLFIEAIFYNTQFQF